MSLGHPATSQSPEMDYVLHEESLLGDPACYTERLLRLPEGAFGFVAPPACEQPAAQPGPGETLRIAIPAVAHKLSWPLLQTLANVAARAQRPLEFHFLTGTRGEQLLEATRQIRRELPQAVVHPALRYPDYLARIATCQLHVASFPFGGTNSLIDSMRLGLPVVALAGREPHEQVDAAFLSRIGLADELVARTPEQLAERALRLVEDDELRVRLGVATREALAAGALLGPGHPEWFVAALAGLLPTPD